MGKLRRLTAMWALTLLAVPAAADTLRVPTPRLSEGSSWSVLALDEPLELETIAPLEVGTFWDLRPRAGAGRLVRWTVSPQGEAVCAEQRGCRSLRAVESTLSRDDLLEVGVAYSETRAESDGSLSLVEGRVVAEGVALLPAGPHEVLMLEEHVRGSGAPLLRYRFIASNGEVVGLLEGPEPAPGKSFAPGRGELRAAPAADDGLEIPYQKLSDALVPGATGFLQYSQENETALSAVHPDWAGVPEMIAVDAANVPYQPDPSDPGTQQVLPEVWDFTNLATGVLTYRTFNTTRDGLAGNTCGEACATYDPGPNPPDGTWQAYLKIDNYDPQGAFLTRDIFDLNDNDTGADPSIDVPYVAQNELDVDGGRTQICFQQSAGGADRLLRFFQFAGPDPSSAVMGLGDVWESGNWTECDNDHGLRLTATILCADACYPECGAVNPRARGLLGNGVGLRSTIVEDAWVHVAPGNYLRSLLMQQVTDIEAGIDLFGVCNLSPTRNRAIDYFWLHEDFGLLALVSSPSNDAIVADDWSVVGNVTDGADFTWGPYPPYQASAQACLSGTRVVWSLPQDGSNLGGNPGVSDYGYVVSWGALTDPEELADWTTNPNHTALPGVGGYLAAPAGSEPTSHVITGWADPAIHATVVTALRYTDPDVGDTSTYASPAFYKVSADPARLDAGSFAVGGGVAPFVSKSGADLTLSWPAVAGAASYDLQVFDLDAAAPIACPAGLDCNPTGPNATHVGAAASMANYGYRVFAIDPCGEASAD